MDTATFLAATYTSSQVSRALHGFNTTTLRKLSLTHSMKFDADDDSSREGWRRYSRADVVRLKIVADLMGNFRVPAQNAIHAVNAIFKDVMKGLAHIDGMLDKHKDYGRVSGPFFIFGDLSEPGRVRRTMLKDADDFAQHLAIDGLIPTSVVVDLRSTERYVRVALQRVVSEGGD